MANPKIVSLCVSGFMGTSDAMKSLAEMSPYSRHFVLTQRSVNGPEAQFLISYIKQIKPRTVVFGSWSEEYEPFIQNIKVNSIDFAVYWTSSAGQTEIGGEMEKFSRILSNPRIKYLLCADENLATSPVQNWKSIYHLPPCFPIGKTEELNRDAKKRCAESTHGNKAESIISFFCSPHELRRKNALNIFLALAGLDENFILYLNGLSGNKNYRGLLQKLGIAYRDFGWMKREKYERVLREVDLGLQISFAESYNQVVADHIMRGIPVIASEMIPVLKNTRPQIRSRIIVANADDCGEIRRKIQYLLKHPRVRNHVAKELKRQFLIDNAQRIERVETVLRELS
jgi:glycosyltransferase involved in cell wall biosynthesis